jgi:branched-subunit amino acid ABC-type transport system permease component
MDLLSEPLDDDGVEAWVYGRVHLRPPSWRDEPKRQLTYVVVMLMWAMSVWVLLTYVTLIRAMQGKEAEELLINTWGLGLLFEQFGKEGIKIVGVKAFVNWYVVALLTRYLHA